MILKLLSYNVRYGGAGREELLAEVVRAVAPDLVVLQEATLPSVVERLASETGMSFWAAWPGDSVAFISRIPVERYEWHPLVRQGRGFLEMVLAGTGIRIYGVHLSAVHSNWTERRRMRELRLLLKKIEPHRDELHLLVGDFNTLAPGEVLETRRLPTRLRALVWLSGGRVNYRTIQAMLDAGYVDGYRFAHPTDKGYTFPTWDPHVRLDFAFLPAPYANRLKVCNVVDGHALAAEASDHFPLHVQIEVG